MLQKKTFRTDIKVTLWQRFLIDFKHSKTKLIPFEYICGSIFVNRNEEGVGD